MTSLHFHHMILLSGFQTCITLLSSHYAIWDQILIPENYIFIDNGIGAHLAVYFYQKKKKTDYNCATCMYRCIFDNTFKTNTSRRKFQIRQICICLDLELEVVISFLVLYFCTFWKKSKLLSSSIKHCISQNHENQHE